MSFLIRYLKSSHWSLRLLNESCVNYVMRSMILCVVFGECSTALHIDLIWAILEIGRKFLRCIWKNTSSVLIWKSFSLSLEIRATLSWSWVWREKQREREEGRKRERVKEVNRYEIRKTVRMKVCFFVCVWERERASEAESRCGILTIKFWLTS